MDRASPDADLLAALAEAATGVFAGTAVFLAYAHGSRVAGRPRPDSDLDVGYYVKHGSSRPALADELEMAGQLSSAVGIEVDLRCLNDAPLEARGRVLERGVRVYCSDEVARVNLERDLLARYHDYKPTLEALRRLRLAAAAARER